MSTSAPEKFEGLIFGFNHGEEGSRGGSRRVGCALGMFLMVSWHAQGSPTFGALLITRPHGRRLSALSPQRAVAGRREGRKWRRYASKFKITLKFLCTDWLWCDHTEPRLLGSQGPAEISKWDLGKAPFASRSTSGVYTLCLEEGRQEGRGGREKRRELWGNAPSLNRLLLRLRTAGGTFYWKCTGVSPCSEPKWELNVGLQ